MSMQEQMEALNKRYHARYGQDESTWTKYRKKMFDEKMKKIVDHHMALMIEKKGEA